MEKNVDLIGAALAAGATAGVLAHAAATGVHQMREKKRQTVTVTIPERDRGFFWQPDGS